MPGTLQRSIIEEISERHRKMLVGADIAQCGYLTVIANEAYRIAGRTDPLQNGSFGQIGHQGDCLELGTAPDRVKKGS